MTAEPCYNGVTLPSVPNGSAFGALGSSVAPDFVLALSAISSPTPSLKVSSPLYSNLLFSCKTIHYRIRCIRCWHLYLLNFYVDMFESIFTLCTCIILCLKMKKFAMLFPVILNAVVHIDKIINFY